MADRIIEEKEWQDGDSMSSAVKEKYKKIIRSRFRTWDGLCFMTAGFFLLAGISPYFIAKGIEFLTGAVTAAWCLVILFVVISLFIKRDCKRELDKIDKGKFFWKQDTVYELLPDRYPKTCKILADSEEAPCVILQAYFYYKKGTYVYLVKKEEDGDIQAFIT